MNDDPLEAILHGAAVEAVLLHQEQLSAVARTMTSIAAEEFFEAVILAPGLSYSEGYTRPHGYFEINSGHWWLDVSVPANRDHLLSVCVAAALGEALDLGLSVSWITMVLPAAVIVEAAVPTADGLLLRLRRLAAPTLTADLADIVNPDDFADFAAALTAADDLSLPGGGAVHFTAPSPDRTHPTADG